jgi:dihydrofolate reductase
MQRSGEPITIGKERTMAKLRCELSISLDGFTAGPEQSEENPLGIGGMQLHEWVFKLAAWRAPHGMEGGETNASSELVEESLTNVGAVVMGRNMFGGGPGPWSEEPRWDGWWGESPPFHTPVYVLTNHAREQLPMQDGTTFHFVTDGIESALRQAIEAAGGKDVSLAGGAHVVQQYLAAGLLDELQLDVVPALLGTGTRLLENIAPDGVALEQVRAVEAPGVTHLKYRVVS